MPIRNAIWTVGDRPQPLIEARLPNERVLEDMIVAAPSILSDQWMLIGRQERTGFGGVVDLLAIAPDGALVLIELKRDKTPREVVAQALDYACWVEQLKSDDIVAIYGRFSSSGNLAADFHARFSQPLDEEQLAYHHEIVVVAAELDAGSERIVAYLNERGIAINVLCFQVFRTGDEQLLSRSWLLDPVEAQASVASTPTGRGGCEREPWNGEFYSSFGHGVSRDWEEARRFGFVCGGGGNWYSNTLRLLNTGDRVWIRAPGHGFFGVGEVIGPREAITDFRLVVDGAERSAAEALRGADYHREFLEDSERMEYFVPVRWLHTVPIENAVDDIGLFGNQNTVCKPTTPKWRTTVERLKDVWGIG